MDQIMGKPASDLEPSTPSNGAQLSLPDAMHQPITAQVQAVLKVIQENVSGIHPRTEEPFELTLSRQAWLELQRNPDFDLCIEQKQFPVSYDSSTAVLTIMPPPLFMHRAILGFLSEVGSGARSKSNEKAQMSIVQNLYVDNFEGPYASSAKQPDLVINWGKDLHQPHTVVEVGKSQSLECLRGLVPLYLTGNPTIQRVVLVKIMETPAYASSSRLPIHVTSAQDLRRDEVTGAIFYGDIQLVGEVKFRWEVWERVNGQPTTTFEEEFGYGELPCRPLPIFKIDAAGMEATVQPAAMKDFWDCTWNPATLMDAVRRARC
ncbi:hypothetical protein AYL99_03065 [Fonsecaea erecta]|uniref:Restriction endonuclease domain-containing protein n=1 Tax=Fonsecaea erecta TaxID=1367422 RepID=A0A178ZVM4_9EURO|nr:hypothetical protein AYL99_03065 [Fonsecaea erecta]OAP63838.1 hypothetical protein AYL99_03065 [Fonsecaea erecta]